MSEPSVKFRKITRRKAVAVNNDGNVNNRDNNDDHDDRAEAYSIAKDFQRSINFEGNVEAEPSDREPIKLEDLPNFPGVLVNVPTIYVNCFSDHSSEATDKIVPNLRAINYEVLCELIELIRTVETNDYDQQIEMSEQLINKLIGSVPGDSTSSSSSSLSPPSKRSPQEDENAKKCLELIRMLCQTSKNLDIQDVFVNSTNEGINLDPIRRYVNDPQTGLLKSVEYCNWRGASFYSQIPDDATKRKAREECNDTDLNRIYFVMSCLNDILLLRPGRVCNRTIEIVNVGLFYLNVHFRSYPVENHCSNDLKNHLIGFIVDFVVRSRLTSAWKKQKVGQFMLSDISRNYSANNPLVVISKLDTAKERAQKLLQLLSAGAHKKELAPLLSNLSYDCYEKELEKTVQIILGQKYYVFTSSFITNVATIEGFTALQSINFNKSGAFDF